MKALISHYPYALEPIEPVLDFDLTKFAFVKGLDAVATLDPETLPMLSKTVDLNLVAVVDEPAARPPAS